MKKSKEYRYVLEISGKYDYAGITVRHENQVANLAVNLFNELLELHNLSERDRELLFYAALLHDAGLSRAGPHHKNSRDIILSELDGVFPKNERVIIACTARYHRKAFPSTEHKYYSLLSVEDQKRVLKISSILRIADALDYSHTNAVASVSCRSDDYMVLIKCKTKGDAYAEKNRAEKKSDLFESAFKMNVKFDCGSK